MEDRTAAFPAGTIVTACAGRESGQIFVVVGHNGPFLLLADGRKRKLARPKKKNPRHVRPLGRMDDNPPPGAVLTDDAVRRAIRAVAEEV